MCTYAAAISIPAPEGFWRLTSISALMVFTAAVTFTASNPHFVAPWGNASICSKKASKATHSAYVKMAGKGGEMLADDVPTISEHSSEHAKKFSIVSEEEDEEEDIPDSVEL